MVYRRPTTASDVRDQRLPLVLFPTDTGIVESIGIATEADSPQAIGRDKTVTLGQVTETDAAFAIVSAYPIGQVSETDTANALAADKTQTPNQVTAADTANALGAEKSQAIGQVSETDTASTLSADKAASIGQVSESDLAQRIAVEGQLASVQETDTTSQITPVKTKTIGQVSTTSSVFPFAIAKDKLIGRALQTSIAWGLIVPALPPPLEGVRIAKRRRARLSQLNGTGRVALSGTVESYSADRPLGPTSFHK